MKAEAWMRRSTLGLTLLAAVDILLSCIGFALERSEP